MIEASNVAVLYHANCADGFAAAWAAYRLYGDKATYIPVTHGKPVPDGLDGKDVLIADFSYKRDTLEGIREIAKSILVLDHHKSAQEDIGDLDYAIFDMDRSGAGITWDVLHKGKTRPKLIDYIEDRDIWNWKLPGAKQILLTFECVPFDFDVWTAIAERMDTEEGLESLRVQGRNLEKYRDAMIERVEKQVYETLVKVTLGGEEKEFKIQCLNSPLFQSEIGHNLCNGYPFSLVWSKLAEGEYRCSFRSTDEGEDVSAIARCFGGGGHRNAAGCTMTAPPEPVGAD